MKYAFACTKKICLKEQEFENPLDASLCHDRPMRFISVRGTETMTESEFLSHSKELVNMLTKTNKAVLELTEVVYIAYDALRLTGASSLRERLEQIKQLGVTVNVQEAKAQEGKAQS